MIPHILATLATLLFGAAALHADDASSPSGRLLATRLTNGTWQVWQTDLTTGASRQLTSDPVDKRYPSTLPDGRVGYCTSNQHCFTVAPGETPRPLLQALWPIRDAAWSPDGRSIVFSKFRTDLIDSANLWIADATTGTTRVLTHAPGIQQNPAWSPDGTQIAYSGGHGYQTYEIYVIDAAGGEPRRLTTNRTHEFLPAWSPDGRRLAYSSDATDDYEIWVMPADGSQPAQLTRSPGLDTRPVWSPDGREIAFATNRTGTLQIWAMAADGGTPRPLETSTAGVGDPWWR